MATSKEEILADASFLESVETSLAGLHKSNLLKLEVDQLLEECRLNFHESSLASQAKEYVESLTAVVQKAPQGSIQKGKCPFPLISSKISSTEMPPGLKIVPNSSFTSLTKPAANANVPTTLDYALVIPDSYWQTKDHLHHRYMDKRNLILWHTAKYLAGEKFQSTVGTVEWRHYNGIRQIPALILTPPLRSSAKSGSKRRRTGPKFRVQIVAAMESLEWIATPRLWPNRSNLKNCPSSTPYYNSLLTRDALWSQVAHEISEEMESSEINNFRDAFTLSKIWCLQRGFLRGHDSLDETQVAIQLLYLYRTKKISPRMAPLQAFTLLVKFWSHEWTHIAHVVPNRGETEVQTIASCPVANLYAHHARDSPLDTKHGDPETLLKCYKAFSASPAILLDSTMKGNMLGTLSPAFCASLSRQAQKSVDVLNSTRNFSALFMANARFWNAFDAYVSIPLASVDWKKLSKHLGNDMSDLGRVEGFSRNLISLMKEALGDRIVNIMLLSNGNGSHESGDSEQIPTHASLLQGSSSEVTPLGEDSIVLGLKINPETCYRAVDRGPPQDDAAGVRKFLALWGEAAELRRFKDGAIVHAVIWSMPQQKQTDKYLRFCGGDQTQGGIVERIMRHILRVHLLHEDATLPQFSLKELLGLVDGIESSDTSIPDMFTNATKSHRNLLRAYNSLSELLRLGSAQKPGSDGVSKLGVPLPIDAVEPLSPSLRYSSLFPPMPHPLLGAQTDSVGKVSGVVVGAPIDIQIKFRTSSNWPTDLKAIGAAKTAMLIQMADAIDKLKTTQEGRRFGGQVCVSPSAKLSFGFEGYFWRISIRADPELHLLKNLHNPNEEAKELMTSLLRQSIVEYSHHAMIHSIHTSHPSASHVVRLFTKWQASHYLSGHIPLEVVELLVAQVYASTEVPMDAPSTVVAGFLRLLHLLSTYDWTRSPMIVDPHCHLNEEDVAKIETNFRDDRGDDFSKGPAMYVVAPYDCKEAISDSQTSKQDQTSQSSAFWRPSLSSTKPERVALFRTVELAKRSYAFLMQCLTSRGGAKHGWEGAFRETMTSLKSYSALLRVDKELILDLVSSSTSGEPTAKPSTQVESLIETAYTRSAQLVFQGPKSLRLKVYQNLKAEQDKLVLGGWTPVEDVVRELEAAFGDRALFFYNHLSPEVIAVLWRPKLFDGKPFSAMNSEFVRPIGQQADWKSDTLVMVNVKDMIRNIKSIAKDVVVDVKVIEQ